MTRRSMRLQVVRLWEEAGDTTAACATGSSEIDLRGASARSSPSRPRIVCRCLDANGDATALRGWTTRSPVKGGWRVAFLLAQRRKGRVSQRAKTPDGQRLLQNN
jgi:hypothetical protein